MKRIAAAKFVLVFIYQATFGQGATNWDWWCTNVGQSAGCPTNNWVDYIDFSPGRMGPNSLPVPEITKGRITSELSIELGAQAHFGSGDNTQNIWTDLNVNIVKEVISLVIYAVPQEHFNISDKTRDARHLSGEYYEPKGYAKGDLYFGMEIQISKNNIRWFLLV